MIQFWFTSAAPRLRIGEDRGPGACQIFIAIYEASFDQKQWEPRREAAGGSRRTIKYLCNEIYDSEVTWLARYELRGFNQQPKILPQGTRTPIYLFFSILKSRSQDRSLFFPPFLLRADRVSLNLFHIRHYIHTFHVGKVFLKTSPIGNTD